MWGWAGCGGLRVSGCPGQAPGGHEKGPARGPCPELGVRPGGSGAEAGGTEGGDQAEGHQERRGETVEGAFEADEGHGAHLAVLSGNPGGAGLSVWTTSM